ncbi:hypothetical protein COL80_16035 [Bacillus thuringiensis]|uniref:hypothetical protein n=1 Tax=Bacillus TaxID=1386 RepID=UPI000BF6085A|nr:MULTISPECIES: hypothetical protein [Bacillus]MCP1324320.1 hypothetical protein [Bacillus sp. S0628]PGA25388.1 hypothetical protein COL80_16035 [Bacillus thuringiensis]
MTKPKAKKQEKPIKCYYCGKIIERSSEHVIKKVPLATKAGIRNYKRQLHLSCVPKYNEKLEDTDLRVKENSDWDAVYQYFRNNILGLDSTIPLDDHTIRRLQGLRLGQFYPSGNNTRLLPRGYDFKTILVAMKVANLKIQPYLKTANFTDGKHRVNFIMRFITDEINDVAMRLESQRKAVEKLKKDEVIETFDYVTKLKEKKEAEARQVKEKTETQSNIEALFGGLL